MGIQTSHKRGRERLQELLDEHERNVSWLARRTHRSVSHLFRVLQGERPLTVELAEACASAFAVPVEELLPGGGE